MQPTRPRQRPIPHGTRTETLTLASQRGILQQPAPQQATAESAAPVLRLHLSRRRRVKWTADTHDNEHDGKKSSKSCCIFHKKRAFDESSSESEQEPEPEQEATDCEQAALEMQNTDAEVKDEDEEGLHCGAPSNANDMKKKKKKRRRRKHDRNHDHDHCHDHGHRHSDSTISSASSSSSSSGGPVRAAPPPKGLAALKNKHYLEDDSGAM